MKKRVLLGVGVILLWITLVNIAISYEYIDWFNVNVKPYDVDAPFGVIDYFLQYFDIAFLFFNETHLFINIIYIAIIYTLLSQIYIFIFNKKNMNESIEFNLNVPPFLGVIGTIYAFAFFISTGKDVSDVLLVLQENFSSAAMTTILGGITYIMNYIILIIDEKLNNKEYYHETKI